MLTRLIEAGHECWADGYVAEAARRNLAATAPEGLPALEALLARVHMAIAQSHPEEVEATRAVAETDRPVLAAAVRLQCEALVTGDRMHFRAFYGKALGGVTIHSLRSLAEALLD